MNDEKKDFGNEKPFAFKGHDIRSGEKKPTVVEAKSIPAGGSLQAEADAIAPMPKPPVEQAPAQTNTTQLVQPITPKPPTIKIPPTPIRPPTTPPIIRNLGTATAPNAPVSLGEDDPKALRTYEGDVAEVLAHKGTSAASIAIAENKRSTGENKIGDTDEPSHAGKKIAITLISLILIGIGFVGAYYLYSISPLAPTPRSTPQTQASPSLVPSDTKAVIPIDGMSPTGIISAARAEIAKPQGANTIKEIILVKANNGQYFRVNGPDMASAMGVGAPSILLRALADDWMLGIYADANGVKEPFAVVTVDYFQNAFAGMLQWESLMADDLKLYLYPNTPADITTAMAPSATTTTGPSAAMGSILPAASSSGSSNQNSSSTQPLPKNRGSFSEAGAPNSAQASGTPSAATTGSIQTPGTSSTTTSMFIQTGQPLVLRGSFIDRIIGNKDVREFVTSDGNVLFLYSFIDNTKLVITGREGALSAILNRLEQQAFVR